MDAQNYGTSPASPVDSESVEFVFGDLELQKQPHRNQFSWFFTLFLIVGCAIAIVLLVNKDAGTILKDQNSPNALDIQETTVKPNFLFILADDMSYNSIGYEPYDMTFTSPFLTKLSAQGIRNLNYYSQEICTPARAALLTGRYPIRYGMQFDVIGETQAWCLNLTETLLPQVLKENSYSTYMLGKWHLGHYSPRCLPTARGFREHMGYLSGSVYYWSKKEPEYMQFHDCIYASEDCYAGYNGTDMHTYSTFLYRDKAIDIITYHNYDKPLFLYLAFQAVHDPYNDENIKGSLPFGNLEDGIPPDYFEDEDVYEEIRTTIVGRKRRQYAMAMRLMDDSISAIYSALVSVGELDNTYIIFASDNGGCSTAGGKNWPLRGTKATLWEGGTRVDSFIYSPLIPESLQGDKCADWIRSTNYSGIMHVTDWFPTILDLAGISYTHKTGYALDGVSQKDAWIHGESHNKRDYLLYNLYYDVNTKAFDDDTDGNAPLAVRNKKYKLIHAFTDNPTSDWYDVSVELDDDNSFLTGTCDQYQALTGNYTYFLYDLESDPYETTNLYYSSDDDAQNATTELYEQIEEFKKGTVRDYGLSYEKHSAKNAWKEHGNYITPWIKEDSLGDVNSYPSYCTFKGFVSPSQYDVDDSTDYDDDLSGDDKDDNDNDWQDDDDASD